MPKHRKFGDFVILINLPCTDDLPISKKNVLRKTRAKKDPPRAVAVAVAVAVPECVAALPLASDLPAAAATSSNISDVLLDDRPYFTFIEKNNDGTNHIRPYLRNLRKEFDVGFPGTWVQSPHPI